MIFVVNRLASFVKGLAHNNNGVLIMAIPSMMNIKTRDGWHKSIAIIHFTYQTLCFYSSKTVSHTNGGIRGMRDRLWIFCGDYTFRVFDLYPRGISDISEDESKMKTLNPIYTINIIYIILKCPK